MSNFQCPYSGECLIADFCSENCFIKQKIEERNQAEACAKELTKENKLLKSLLGVALTSLVFIRDVPRDSYSSRRAAQTLQKIRQMEKQAEDGNNDR